MHLKLHYSFAPQCGCVYYTITQRPPSELAVTYWRWKYENASSNWQRHCTIIIHKLYPLQRGEWDVDIFYCSKIGYFSCLDLVFTCPIATTIQYMFFWHNGRFWLHHCHRATFTKNVAVIGEKLLSDQLLYKKFPRNRMTALAFSCLSSCYAKVSLWQGMRLWGKRQLLAPFWNGLSLLLAFNFALVSVSCTSDSQNILFPFLDMKCQCRSIKAWSNKMVVDFSILLTWKKTETLPW